MRTEENRLAFQFKVRTLAFTMSELEATEDSEQDS